MQLKKPLRIALIGNPNCGKSTIFNLLTQGHQSVGNWSGVTVEKHVGLCNIDSATIEIIDLPGIYSLTITDDNAIDEQIAAQFLRDEKIDLLLNIVDAANLSRSLYLSSQLLEMDLPILVITNMCDLAKAKNLELDVLELSRSLQAMVVNICAKKADAAIILKRAISQALAIDKRKPLALYTQQPLLQKAINNLAAEQSASYWQAVQTLENAENISPSTAVASAQISLREAYDEEADMLIINTRLRFADEVTAKVIHKKNHTLTKRQKWEQLLDNILLSKFFGIPILGLIMYIVFAFSLFCSKTLGDQFVAATHLLITQWPLQLMNYLGLHIGAIEIALPLIAEGVGMIVQFIPAIAGLYIALGILEDSGYMMRAAFLLDHMMRKIGLPGKAFIPLILGFGCNVPAITATRTMERQQDRIITIMMLPFMSCSARLATYTLFISIFFPQGGHSVLFFLYLISISVAVFTGMLVHKFLATSGETPFIASLPDYNWPNFKNILRRSKNRVEKFTIKAGMLIFAAFIILQGINLLTNGAQLPSSWRAGITSIFQPMGISADNWPAVVGILSGTIAKEMVVGTLGGMYLQDAAAKEMGLALVMQTQFGSQAAVIAYLLFILLYFPCISVFATIMRELNFKWALFSALWSTSIAYAIAVSFYQLSLLANYLL